MPLELSVCCVELTPRYTLKYPNKNAFMYAFNCMLQLWNCHSSGVTRYHSMMMSAGDGIRFIIYKQALLPHQRPPGTCPSTTSSPPTLEWCHSSCGVLTQSKHLSQCSLWINIKMTPAIITFIWNNLQLALVIASVIETPELNQMERY